MNREEYLNGVSVIAEMNVDDLDRVRSVLLNGMGRPNRRSVIDRFLEKGFAFESLIHPSSSIGDFVSIGVGTIIQSGVGIMTNVGLGKFLLIDINATIGHDVTIGNYTTISTGSNIAGNVTIGQGCWIGSGSILIERVSIGDNSLIGAGSVVTGDIEKRKRVNGITLILSLAKAILMTDWGRNTRAVE